MNNQKRNAGKTRKSARPARLGAHGSPSSPGSGAERDAEEPARSAWLERVRPAPGSARVPRPRPAGRGAGKGERTDRAGLGKVGGFTCGTEPAKTETPP